MHLMSFTVKITNNNYVDLLFNHRFTQCTSLLRQPEVHIYPFFSCHDYSGALTVLVCYSLGT